MKYIHDRKLRTRNKIKKTSNLPRLSVFRSDKHIYAQVIDQENGKILAQASDLGLDKASKTAKAEAVGKLIAQACKIKKIKQVVFDRGPYKYHGRVKALAEAARKEKLTI